VLTEREGLAQEQLEERVIRIDRTRKTVAGGRLSSARVVVAIGDHKGSIGLGIGKARNVPEAIEKGIKQAKKNMIRIPLDGYTIPYTVQAKVGGAIILLKPASRGTGIVAGGATRQLIEISGIRDILTKSLGSGNVMNRAKSCFKALSILRDPHTVAEDRETTVEEMLGRQVVDAYAAQAELEEAEADEEVAEKAEEAAQELVEEAEEAEGEVAEATSEAEEAASEVEVEAGAEAASELSEEAELVVEESTAEEDAVTASEEESEEDLAKE